MASECLLVRYPPAPNQGKLRFLDKRDNSLIQEPAVYAVGTVIDDTMKPKSVESEYLDKYFVKYEPDFKPIVRGTNTYYVVFGYPRVGDKVNFFGNKWVIYHIEGEFGKEKIWMITENDIQVGSFGDTDYFNSSVHQANMALYNSMSTDQQGYIVNQTIQQMIDDGTGLKPHGAAQDVPIWAPGLSDFNSYLDGTTYAALKDPNVLGFNEWFTRDLSTDGTDTKPYCVVDGAVGFPDSERDVSYRPSLVIDHEKAIYAFTYSNGEWRLVGPNDIAKLTIKYVNIATGELLKTDVKEFVKGDKYEVYPDDMYDPVSLVKLTKLDEKLEGTIYDDMEVEARFTSYIVTVKHIVYDTKEVISEEEFPGNPITTVEFIKPYAEESMSTYYGYRGWEVSADDTKLKPKVTPAKAGTTLTVDISADRQKVTLNNVSCDITVEFYYKRPDCGDSIGFLRPDTYDEKTWAAEWTLWAYTWESQILIEKKTTVGKGTFHTGSQSATNNNYFAGRAWPATNSYYNNYIKGTTWDGILMTRTIRNSWYNFASTSINWGGSSANVKIIAPSADEVLGTGVRDSAAYGVRANGSAVKSHAQTWWGKGVMNTLAWTRTGHQTGRSTPWRPFYQGTGGDTDYNIGENNGGSYDFNRGASASGVIDWSKISLKWNDDADSAQNHYWEVVIK